MSIIIDFVYILIAVILLQNTARSAAEGKLNSFHIDILLYYSPCEGYSSSAGYFQTLCLSIV